MSLSYPLPELDIIGVHVCIGLKLGPKFKSIKVKNETKNKKNKTLGENTQIYLQLATISPTSNASLELHHCDASINHFISLIR